MFLCLFRRCFFLLLFCLAGALPPAASAQDVVQQQNQIKLAYLFHFLQQVKWPNEEAQVAEAPIVIGVIGRDPFGDNIDALMRKKVRGRAILIRRFVDAGHMEPCHLLFVGAGQGGNLPEILRRADAGSALTVSDMREFVAQGGMIGFVLAVAEQEGGVKVRFEVNLEAARRKGLQISAKLLELATQVRQ